MEKYILHSLNIAADIYSTELVMDIIKGGSLNANDLKMTLLAADKIKASKLKDATKNMWTLDEFKSIFQETSIDTNGLVYKALERKLNSELLQIGDFQNAYIAGKETNEKYKVIADYFLKEWNEKQPTISGDSVINDKA